MLYLSNDDVQSVLTMREAIDALEAAYRELARGRAVCRPRIDLRLPSGTAGRAFQWGTMEGGSTGSGYFAIRIKSDIVYEERRDGILTEEKYCLQPGRFCGLVLLFRIRDAAPVALLNDGYLQHVRVAADAGIGARCLARPDASVIGMLGSGGMARAHVEALAAVRPIQAVRVYSPTPAHREAFAREMNERHDIACEVCGQPQDVYQGIDVLCSCTDAVDLAVSGAWLQPGTHVTRINGGLDELAAQRVDVWLRFGDAPAPVDRPGWATGASNVTYQAAPDDPVWSQLRKRGRDATFGRPRAVVTLDDLLSGRHPGRTAPEQVTFSERGNLQGVQFQAVAGRVYDLAVAGGLGQEIPTDWMLQSIRD